MNISAVYHLTLNEVNNLDFLDQISHLLVRQQWSPGSYSAELPCHETVLHNQTAVHLLKHIISKTDKKLLHHVCNLGVPTTVGFLI